jgi:hypothetical protein
MARRHLRTALAGLTLTITLAAAPPLAADDGGYKVPNLAEAVWQWVVGLWTGDTSEIGFQIDPNGIGFQIDPDGSTTPAGETGDIGLQIDPNG